MAEKPFDLDDPDWGKDDDELPPDPKPQRVRKTTSSQSKRSTPRRSAAAKPRDPIGGALAAAFIMLGEGWAAADPLCGGVFLKQAPKIAQQLSAMADADEKVYDFLNTLTMHGGLALIFATLPVVITVTNHHIAPAIQKRRENARENSAPPEAPVDGNSEAALGTVSG